MRGFLKELSFLMVTPPKDEDTIVVSEAVCSDLIRLACERYLQCHPENSSKVKELLGKLSF